MMKVGILTQPLGLNYGGIVQNYALQEVLRQEGHRPVTLRRENYLYLDDRRLLRRFFSYVYCRYFLPNYEEKRRFLTPALYKSIKKNTEFFIAKYIDASALLRNQETLRREVMKGAFDVLLVGSDQTWRPRYSPYLPDYFLEFLPRESSIKRVAYASSFGTDEWEFSEEETQMARELLRYFDAVSVREECGVHFCQEHLEHEATLVLDPTLLLSREEYVKRLKLREEAHGKVFAYLLDATPEKRRFAEEVAREVGTTAFEMMPKMTVYDRWKEVSDYQLKPVENWLENILNAEFVVTDSFHGAVFSTIFDKPFVVVENKERGLARFATLKQFVSADAFVEEEELASYQLATPSVDQQRLDDFREHSLKFLRDSLA